MKVFLTDESALVFWSWYASDGWSCPQIRRSPSTALSDGLITPLPVMPGAEGIPPGEAIPMRADQISDTARSMHLSELEVCKSRLKKLPEGSPRPSDVMEACKSIPFGQSTIHVLSGSSRGHRHSGNVKYYLWSKELPSGSFYRIDDNLYAASPEFAFLRMAKKLGFEELVYLGCLLSGSFTMHRACGGQGIPYDSEPVTSKLALLSFLEKARGGNGARPAKRAAKHVIDGAASPKEIELALSLTLPKYLGGYGLPAPILNQKLEKASRRQARSARKRLTSDRLGNIVAHSNRTVESAILSIQRKRIRGDSWREKGSLIADAAWPDFKLALEYDSDLWHTGAEKISKDSMRRNDIVQLGYDVRTITNRELQRMDRIDGIAMEIASRLEVKPRTDPSNYLNRKIKLRRELNKAKTRIVF